MSRAVFPFAAAAWCCGCAVQVGPGAAIARGEQTATFHAAGTVHVFRPNRREPGLRGSSVVGLRANAAIEHGFAWRSATLHGGYDWLVSPGHLTLEPGFDVGVGKPMAGLYDGIGAYWGASGTARLRLWPWGDEPAYNLAFPAAELVLSPQLGLWSPPEGAVSHSFILEGGGWIGLRLAIGSDIITNGQGQVWDGGPDCEDGSSSDESCGRQPR